MDGKGPRQREPEGVAPKGRQGQGWQWGGSRVTASTAESGAIASTNVAKRRQTWKKGKGKGMDQGWTPPNYKGKGKDQKGFGKGKGAW